MLDNESNAGLFTVDRHNDPAVGRDVRLSEQSYLVAQNSVRQVIHDDLSGRTSSDGLFALHYN